MEIKKISPKKHVVHADQFDVDYLFEIFHIAQGFKNEILQENKEEFSFSKELLGKSVAIQFYEPSTRTFQSFDLAIKLLGGVSTGIQNAGEFSSAAKGEKIEDTIKYLCEIYDFIVLRNPFDNSSIRAMNVSKVPIINAGSGKEQHPTQALLDTFTIFDKFKRLSHLKIAIMGDLLRGRTCYSLIYLMSKFEENEFIFISPENSKIKNETREFLEKNNIKFKELDKIDETVSNCDVCYVTRVQKERFENKEEYEKAKGKLIINKENINLFKESSIIMHPLPRIDEISNEVDNDKRCIYFEQARNGLYVRMAILKLLNQNI